jgi:hypothetical protein
LEKKIVSYETTIFGGGNHQKRKKKKEKNIKLFVLINKRPSAYCVPYPT